MPEYEPPKIEPSPSLPTEPGSCEWCGKACKGRTYCSAACRVAYNNLLAKQGKTVMQMLKVWRKHRGRKGTPGQGMLSEVAARVDLYLEQDRERRRCHE